MPISQQCVAFVLVTASMFGVPRGEPNQYNIYNYRVMFYKTFGGDHTCLTEVAFFDADGSPMNATYHSMSSCFGCASCDGCAHRYGNPMALFDGKWEDSEPNDWTCTAPGSFRNGEGQQSLMVALATRPAKAVLQMASADGDWVTREWALEELQNDQSWWILGTSANATQSTQQELTMFETPTPSGGVVGGANWDYANQDWGKEYPACNGPLQSPIALHAGMDIPRGSDSLNYAYTPLQYRALANTGLGLQVGGKFGSITLPNGEVYESTQFHFHFPAEHQMEPPAGKHPPLGEMQIVHQKAGSTGSDDLLMLSIPLNLPEENPEQNVEELWFRGLGLLQAPSVGSYSHPFKRAVDLNIFNRQLKGGFWYYQGSVASPPCSGNVHWIVLQEQAHISGDIVNVLQRSPSNARAVQDAGGRQIWINKLPNATSELGTL